MPVVTEMGFLAAVGEVLARCGQGDDGGTNPLLAQEAKAHLNSAQRQLRREMPSLALTRESSLAVLTGSRLIEPPADCDAGQIQACRWVDTNGIRMPLQGGIDQENQRLPGWPERFKGAMTKGCASVTIGAGGTGAVTGAAVTVTGGTRATGGTDPTFLVTATSGVITSIVPILAGTGWSLPPTINVAGVTGATLTVVLGNLMAVELWPPPVIAGTLEIVYRAIPVTMVADADPLSYDTEAVIGRAAWLLASTKATPVAQALLAAHNAYLTALSATDRPGETFSMRRKMPGGLY